MSPGRRIDRRRFLVGALGAGSVVALAGLRPWRALVEVRTPSLVSRLAAQLERPESAVVVGREYLAARASGGADAGSLARALVGDLPGGARAAASASGSDLRELLLRGVREDFDSGRIVNLRGWVVSRTEARLCALVAVEQGRDGGRAA